MKSDEIIAALTSEIDRLTSARDLLLGAQARPARRSVGRPGTAGRKASSGPAESATPRRRTMSAEGKARIAAAQRKRWAAQKGGTAAAAKTTKPAKKAPRKAPAKAPARKAAARRPQKTASKAAPEAPSAS